MKADHAPRPTIRGPKPKEGRGDVSLTYTVALVAFVVMLAYVVLGVITGRNPRPWGLL